MTIKYFCPRWGSEHQSWKNFCREVKQAGYDGIEAWVPFDPEQKDEIINALKENGLLLIGQFYQSFEKDFEEHAKSFEKHLYHLALLKPQLIDSQTGKDYFTAAQNTQLFEIAKAVSTKTNVPIAHETHRNKALFAAHVAHQLLTGNTDVQITADFSHWCNVSESLLEQQEEALNLAISRATHIHARVGHSQGAQVTDPRAKEWNEPLEAHLSWWDKILKHRVAAGDEIMTITTEFGPHPYMVHLPYTQMPVANQWDINVYMMQLLRKRYSGFNKNS